MVMGFVLTFRIEEMAMAIVIIAESVVAVAVVVVVVVVGIFLKYLCSPAECAICGGGGAVVTAYPPESN
jgi:hypothetical protein